MQRWVDHFTQNDLGQIAFVAGLWNMSEMTPFGYAFNPHKQGTEYDDWISGYALAFENAELIETD